MRAAQPTPRAHRRLRRAVTAAVCALAVAQVVGWFVVAPRVGQFRGEAERDAYLDAYTEAFTRMPTPTRTLDVRTSFGTVRAYEWANPAATGDPVVLLPGRGSGVPMWSENLPSLRARRTGLRAGCDRRRRAVHAVHTPHRIRRPGGLDRRSPGRTSHRPRTRRRPLLRSLQCRRARGSPARTREHPYPARARLRAPLATPGHPAVVGPGRRCPSCLSHGATQPLPGSRAKTPAS